MREEIILGGEEEEVEGKRAGEGEERGVFQYL